MQAILIKQWCDENLTPIAWKRIIIRIFPYLREQGFSILDLENANQNITFNTDTIDIITKTIYNMYNIQIDFHNISNMHTFR